jgi:hypothetical protein
MALEHAMAPISVPELMTYASNDGPDTGRSMGSSGL